MTEPLKPDGKEGETFLRKVARFVSNPTTDWAELNTRIAEDDPAQSGYAKSELKAMIERKRRNDFVRKREFDLLRKIRREGLPADGLSALAGSSNLDDSDPPRYAETARADAAVKAKIDEIEAQIEGETAAARRPPAMLPPSFYTVPTVSSSLDEAPAMNLPFSAGAPDAPPAEAQIAPAAAEPVSTKRGPLEWNAPTAATPLSPIEAVTSELGRFVQQPQPPAPAPPPAKAATGSFTNPFAVEVNELAHDPELDEAVISFANADFEGCERSIIGLIGPGSARHQHAETWLVLFDLYRATGQQSPFEGLALDYAQQFGWSAPQWFSIPALVAADAAMAASRHQPSASRIEGHVGWVAPELLDHDSVARLRAQALQMPLPWVLDWGPIEAVEAEACGQLTELLRHWSTQVLSMRWIGVERLLSLLAEIAPIGIKDADPVYWMLRMEILRIVNRPDQFDEVAIDYCVTYEVSPPSWEGSKCTVKLADHSGVTIAPKSAISDVSTGFVESQLFEEATTGAKTAVVELSGQLTGDIGAVLGTLEATLGDSTVVSINCQRLIRMDFIAAGDLLNWVLARRSEQRLVHFDDTHRLLGLFFNAMGINEHSRVKVRNI